MTDCSVAFTDATGAATLKNNFAGTAACRFSNWTPMNEPIGDGVNTLATGALVFFENRTDYGASFELAAIPVKAQIGATNYVAIAARLIAHLKRGGQCSVTTGDTPGNVYATCGLWPGTSPSLRITNVKTLEYGLSLQLINLAVSPVQLLAVYG
jgi:hypothetical protein